MEESLYKPLQSSRREIRLLYLAPGRELIAQPSCRLQKVCMSSSPAYEALSYTWGDANVTKPIQVNGRTFQATVNLEAALRYLRRPEKTRILWVDAVCIDQNNIQERRIASAVDEVYL